MNNLERKPLGKGLVMAVLLLAITAGAAVAAIPGTTDYRNATQPMITGTVLMVNDHEMLVATEQGEEVMLTLDSKSLVPAELAADMIVRVEFHYLNNGDRHAGRVMPVRPGDRFDRELAYSQEPHSGVDDARFASTNDSEAEAAMAVPTRGTHRQLVSAVRVIPATHDYDIATRPMIAGSVVAVNDHRIVVDTESGQRVTVEMDSRTLVPSSLRSGIGVRVDYKVMPNGEYLARRITEDQLYVGDGERVALVPSEDMSEEGVEAVPASYEGSNNTAANDVDQQGDQAYAANQEGSGEGNQEGLPDTAGEWSLLAFAGVLALGAGVLAFRRRKRIA